MCRYAELLRCTYEDAPHSCPHDASFEHVSEDGLSMFYFLMGADRLASHHMQLTFHFPAVLPVVRFLT